MGRRLIFLIGALILLGAVVAVVLLSGSDNGGGEAETSTTGEGTGTPPAQGGDEMQGMVEIVVALQNLSRGMVIPAGTRVSKSFIFVPISLTSLIYSYYMTYNVYIIRKIYIIHHM